ncbi:MAG: CAP domain-containing protein [Steroidobacteraceae bacterium]
MYSRAAILLLLLAAIAPPTRAANIDFQAEINAIRAQGCAGRPGARPALRPAPQLDLVAQALASGSRLADAMKDAGYVAVQSAALEVSGSDAGIARELARRGCADIVDPVYRELGIATRADRAWIVLAMPLVPPAANDAADTGRRVLELVNEARASARRCGWKRFDAAPPLATSDALRRAALEHARDMARRGSLSHTGGDGSTHAERATRAGYPWRVVGENIAAGQPTAEQVVAGWLKSAGHCANLMDPEFTEMGVAYAVAPQDDKGIYWAQMFAAPRP